LTDAEARAFVQNQSTAHVFQGRLKSDGRVTASRQNEIFQADLIDYSKRSAEGARFILTVVDVFSRHLWVEPLKTKQPAEVVEALKRILHRSGPPHQITTDLGGEFGKPFDEFLTERGVVHATKDPKAVNTLAVVDRAIGKYKSILANLMTKKGGTWSGHVEQAEAVFNDRPNSHLLNSTPNDVKGNDVLQYELEAQAGDDALHNYELWTSRVQKLRSRGAFRAPLPRAQWERIDTPKFGGKVHIVKAIIGPEVEDTEGQRFPVKQVLAVANTAHDVDLPDELFPNAARRSSQKEALKEYADELKQKLRESTDAQLSFAKVAAFLKALPGLEDTMDVQRFPRAACLVKFLRLFDFTIHGAGVKMVVGLPAVRASSASGASRPSASSASGPSHPGASSASAPASSSSGSGAPTLQGPSAPATFMPLAKKPITLLFDAMKAKRKAALAAPK